MGKGYVPVFYDWLEVTEALNAEEKGRLIDAIVMYARGDDYSGMIQGNERFLFPAFKQQIDRSAEISEARSRAGGTRRESTMAVLTISNPLQTVTNASKPEQTGTKPSKPEQKRFTPPIMEEVRAYCRERGNKVDPERFIDFYASKGWKVGNQPMKDWKACVRTWEKRDEGYISGKASSGKADWTHGYEQRDYSGLDAEVMSRFGKEVEKKKQQEKA